jgi:hypothetical protein
MLSGSRKTDKLLVDTPRPALTGRRSSAITWRSMLLAVLIIPLNAYWVIQMEIVRYSAHPTTVSLFFNAIFILLVLTALNAIFARLFPGRQLSQGELLIIYSLVCIGSAICGHDFVEVLVPQIAYPIMYGDNVNRWGDLFLGQLPTWLTITDKDAVTNYFLGNSSIYNYHYLSAWLQPLAMWGLFIAALLLVMMSMNTIIRQQWDRREALTYPLTMLPIEITHPGGRLFRQRLFWVGFAIAAGIDIINGLSFYFPNWPHIPIEEQNLAGSFAWPWNAVEWLPMSFYPFVIGIGALMPVDFLFSCWFFFIFWKLEKVAVAWLGFTSTQPNFPYINQQAFGAYMVFCLVAIWQSRRHLAAVWRRALGRADGADDTEEPATYRTALICLVIGLAVLIYFSLAMGMSTWLAVAFFAVYFALSISVLRMRAEFGCPVHDLHVAGPDWTFTVVGGTRVFSQQNLVAMSEYLWFNRAYRSHPMPHQLEGFRMQRASGTLDRRTFPAMYVMSLFAVAAAFWAVLYLMYVYGARAKSAMTFGGEPYSRLAGWLNNPQDPNYSAALAVGVGFLIAFFLARMRLSISGWPFHPLGFAISSNWEIYLVVMPLFIAWIIKALLLRYGGLQGFRKALPFFYGLILGQFVVGSLLNLFTMAFGIRKTYMFWQ